MTIIKFTASVTGNNPDELQANAVKAANDFYRDLPHAPVFVGAEISFDPEWYQSRVQDAIEAAQKKADDFKEAHPDEDGIEVVPAEVPRYDGYFNFEYEVNVAPKTQTMEDVNAAIRAEREKAEAEEYKGAPENNPKYQDKF